MKRRMLLGLSNFKMKLYGYYPFSDLLDYTIEPANITGNFTQFVTGKLNNAIEFLNTGAASLRNNSAKFSFTDGVKDVPFSFSFWIYYKGGGSGNRFIFGRNVASGSLAATNAEYQLYISNTTNKLVMLKYSLGNNKNGKTITCDTALSLNTWYHIVYTDDGLGGENFFINSELKSVTKANTGTGFIRMSFCEHAIIGFGNSLGVSGTAYRFLGMLDDFGIFKNHVLTQREIDYIYNGGIGIALK